MIFPKRNNRLEPKMKKLSLVINTKLSKSMAYDAVNDKLTGEIPLLKKYASQLSRTVAVADAVSEQEEPADHPREILRDRFGRIHSHDEKDAHGFAVRANIKFRSRGTDNSDVIVELTSSSRLRGAQSGEEVRILRSLLWRLGRVVINGLSD
jgi:hypothetical protein